MMSSPRDEIHCSAMWWDSMTTRQPIAHYHRSQQQELAPALVLVGGDGQDARAIHGSSRSANGLSKARRRGHSGLTQRTSAVYAIWWWWWWCYTANKPLSPLTTDTTQNASTNTSVLRHTETYSCCIKFYAELVMGWVHPWVGLGWIGSEFFNFWWVGLGWVGWRLDCVIFLTSRNTLLSVNEHCSWIITFIDSWLVECTVILAANCELVYDV